MSRAHLSVTCAMLALCLAATPAAAYLEGGASASTPAAGSGAAADKTGVTQLLNLEQALALSEKHNRELARAREYASWVEGRYLEERARALPQLTLSGHYNLSQSESEEAFGGGDDVTATGAGFSLFQPLFTWGKIPAAIRVARSGRSIAAEGIKSSRQISVKTVTSAFYDVLLAREFAAIARESLAQRERHLDKTRRRHGAGTATDYDVLAAEVASDNARPEAIRAENQVRMARERLRLVIGLGSREVDAAGSLDSALAAEAVPYLDFEQAYAEALSTRPELSSLRNRITVARDLVTIAAAADKPGLDLTGSLGWNQVDMGGATGKGADWAAGIVFTWPLFDGFRTEGQVAQAESDLAGLRLSEAELVDAIALEAREAVNAVREAGEIMRALTGTVSQAEKLLSMAEKGFELGVKTRLDVQDAQLNLSSAKGGLSRARRDYLVARVNLDFTTGRLCVEGCRVPGM
jgi:outer membrane protein TolC